MAFINISPFLGLIYNKPHLWSDHFLFLFKTCTCSVFEGFNLYKEEPWSEKHTEYYASLIWLNDSDDSNTLCWCDGTAGFLDERQSEADTVKRFNRQVFLTNKLSI